MRASSVLAITPTVLPWTWRVWHEPPTPQKFFASSQTSLGPELPGVTDWTMTRPEIVDFTGKDAGYRYLRSKGNSIEGGTSEILRNVVSERILGLPSEHRVDKDIPWKDLPR